MPGGVGSLGEERTSSGRENIVRRAREMKAHITRELEACNKEDKIGEKNLAPLVGGEQKKKNSQVHGSLLCP